MNRECFMLRTVCSLQISSSSSQLGWTESYVLSQVNGLWSWLMRGRDLPHRFLVIPVVHQHPVLVVEVGPARTGVRASERLARHASGQHANDCRKQEDARSSHLAARFFFSPQTKNSLQYCEANNIYFFSINHSTIGHISSSKIWRNTKQYNSQELVGMVRNTHMAAGVMAICAF